MSIVGFIISILIALILREGCLSAPMYFEIRSNKSNSFYKKTKAKSNIFKRFFFVEFKEYTSPVLYYGNIIFSISIALYLLIGVFFISTCRYDLLIGEGLAYCAINLLVWQLSRIRFGIRDCRQNKHPVTSFFRILVAIFVVILILFATLEYFGLVKKIIIK